MLLNYLLSLYFAITLFVTVFFCLYFMEHYDCGNKFILRRYHILLFVLFPLSVILAFIGIILSLIISKVSKFLFKILLGISKYLHKPVHWRGKNE